MGAQSFQKSRNHFKILDARRVTQSKFPTDYPQISHLCTKFGCHGNLTLEICALSCNFCVTQAFNFVAWDSTRRRANKQQIAQECQMICKGWADVQWQQWELDLAKTYAVWSTFIGKNISPLKFITSTMTEQWECSVPEKSAELPCLAQHINTRCLYSKYLGKPTCQ